jgi:hypothetical protein
VNGEIRFILAWWLATGVAVCIYKGMGAYHNSQRKLSEGARDTNVRNGFGASGFNQPSYAHRAIDPDTVIPGESVVLSENRITEDPAWLESDD